MDRHRDRRSKDGPQPSGPAPERVVERVSVPPTKHSALALGRAAGNAAVVRALSESALRPRPTDRQDAALAGVRALQRQQAPAPEATTKTYQVGPNTYNESQWGTAIGEVADLWTMVGGMVSKRKEAVAEFSGTGGAGAAASPTVADQIVEAAITAAIAAATDGVGTALGAALGRSVTALARKLPLDPEIVLNRGNQVVEFAVSKGKEQANTRLGQAMRSTPTPTPGGGTDLATPLAKYASALNETLDADGRGARAETVQRLLNQPNEPAGVKWAVAAALYQALGEALETCKRAQWSAISDGWFSMQIQSGAGQYRGYDTGIVVIDLKDVYPNESLRASGAFLGGQGANPTTMTPYNTRPLREIGLPIRIHMENGSMGRGVVSCGWQIFKPLGTDAPSEYRHITRWGPGWLAAKALGLRDIDPGDRRIDNATVMRGARMVWTELSGQTAAGLGTSFSAMSTTSGVDSSPF
jgi:hypothetical protein